LKKTLKIKITWVKKELILAKSMDDKWDINVVEFPRNGSKSISNDKPAFEGGQMVLSIKHLVILANVAGLTVLVFVGAGLGIGLTQNNFKSINYTCNIDSDCKSGFLCQNNLCDCKITQYYDGKSCSKLLQAPSEK
jgi:hypothetical protein